MVHELGHIIANEKDPNMYFSMMLTEANAVDNDGGKVTRRRYADATTALELNQIPAPSE